MRLWVALGCAVAACAGSKPRVKVVAKHPPREESPAESEADREQVRRGLAEAIVPKGSNCLPVALKDDNAPRLELGVIDKQAIVCALDVDPDRLLGPVACWQVDLKSGDIAYRDAAPLPGVGYAVKLEHHCARGFCLPEGDDGRDARIAHLAYSLDGTKLVALVGDTIHVFDAASKAHQTSFGIRGDNGVTKDPVALRVVGETVFVEGADTAPSSSVWGFKLDGTALGRLGATGAKDDTALSTYHGAFTMLDGNRVAIAERGYETVTIFELDTGNRSRLVRRVGRPSCKPEEIEAFWRDGDKVTDRCKDSMGKLYGAYMGATMIAGTSSLLAVLRADRLGELAVLDSTTLAEKRAIKMPFCEGKTKSD